MEINLSAFNIYVVVGKEKALKSDFQSLNGWNETFAQRNKIRFAKANIEDWNLT